MSEPVRVWFGQSDVLLIDPQLQPNASQRAGGSEGIEIDAALLERHRAAWAEMEAVQQEWERVFGTEVAQ